MASQQVQHITARLTAEQRAVVEHDSGHARVSAVAGAGKTSTLLARVLTLLERGAAPERMLILMFNRAAREEFAQRLADQADRGQRLPQVRTFHSVGMRLCTTLMRWGKVAERRLLDAEWQRERLARQAVQDIRDEFPELSDEALQSEQLEVFAHYCDRVKGELTPPEVMLEKDDFGTESAHFPRAYHRQEEIYQEQGVMTYADLLHLPLRALAREPEIKTRLHGFLDYLIIDEYQDINEAQLRLLSVLASPHAQVMAVGDANQCIYEWRGARVDAMLDRFERYFKEPLDYPLSCTFRHGHSLALLANQAIQANHKRPDQLTLALAEAPPTTIQVASGSDPLLDDIRAWQQAGKPLADCAVLVRSWALSVPVQLGLMRAGIPFQLGREDRFVFRLPLVQALAGYLQLAVDASRLKDAEHLQMLFSQPASFIPRDRLERLCHYLAREGEWPASGNVLLEGMKPFQRRNLEKRWRLLKELVTLVDWSAVDVLEKVVDELDAHKLLRKASARREKGEEDVRLVDVLVDQARQAGGNIEDFVSLLLSPVATASDGVMISTVHGAKGLEWPQVLVWGLNEEDFPSYGRDMPLSPSALEEERRLFYVAVTRARHRLTLFHDGGERRPSRFISETDWVNCSALGHYITTRYGGTPEQQDSALKALGSAPYRVKLPELVSRYLKAFDMALPLVPLKDPLHEWLKGDWLTHESFGRGQVERVEGEAERCILEVRFERAGKRRLLAARAPITAA